MPEWTEGRPLWFDVPRIAQMAAEVAVKRGGIRQRVTFEGGCWRVRDAELVSA